MYVYIYIIHNIIHMYMFITYCYSRPGNLSPSLKTPVRSPSLRQAQLEQEMSADPLHTVEVVPSTEIRLFNQQSR